MQYALFSLWNKEGSERFAVRLNNLGYRILSTGGTYEYLRSKGVDVVSVEEITGFGEMLSGRVKTLHPFIFGGILFRRGKDEEKLPRIDWVFVNLYPFEEKMELDEEELIEFIDIGGVSLIRAGAKNYKDVVVVCTDEDMEMALSEFEKKGEVSIETRRKLFLKAIYTSSRYDALIYNHFLERWNVEKFEMPMIFAFEKLYDLRYGENPHQKGFLYKNEFYRGFSDTFEKLWGKELSFNNILDIYSAYEIIMEFDGKSCAIVKHGNPCGVSEDEDSIKAYEKALQSDKISAYGGIVVFNFEISEELANKLNQMFYEVVIAPSYSEEAMEILKKKRRRILIRYREKLTLDYYFKPVFRDILISTSDNKLYERLEVVSGKLTNDDKEDVIFGLKVVKHVKSNAIVLVKGKATVGIGEGQTSRIGALKVALEKAGNRAEGSIMVSDAFLPFPDSVELAVKNGIRLIVQPGGSVRDEDVINKANEMGICMVLTGVRHFKH